jgi:hypothetical protein
MKYLIHDHYAGQQSLIDTLPSGYTALDYEHEDTPGIIEALGDGVNIAAIPSVVAQLSMKYLETPTTQWICVPIGHCTNWTEVQAALTLTETEQAEAWARNKQWMEDNGYSIPE